MSHTHAAVAAPAGLAIGILEMDLGPQSHGNVAGALPRSGWVVHRAARLSQRPKRVQNGQFYVVEKFALRKEIEDLGLQVLSDGGVFCNEAYVIDRTDARTDAGRPSLCRYWTYDSRKVFARRSYPGLVGR